MATINSVANGLSGSSGSGSFAGTTSPTFVTPTLGTVQSASTWNGQLIIGTYGGTGVNNGINTLTYGGNVSIASTLSTTGTFSSGGNFSTGSTFATTGTFSSGGNFSTSSTVSITGAFSTAAAFTVSGAFATTLTVTAGTSVTLPTTGTLATTSQVITNNNVTGTSATMAASNLYVANNAGLVTLTVPSTAAVGDTIWVVGGGAGGWKIAVNTSGKLHVGNAVSTITTGAVASSNQYDCCILTCIVANNEWALYGVQSSGLTIT